VLRLGQVPVAVRGPPQDADLPGAGPVQLAPAGAFSGLGSLVFGDHALDLHHQGLLRGVGPGIADEHQLGAVLGELPGQQHLVGVVAGQPVPPLPR
jgi:hypothetical protein